MTSTGIAQAWSELIQSQSSCRRCSTECTPALIHEGARPLFGRFDVWQCGVLFLFEAPNWDDTFNKDKGYLTYDCETDPSGRFARQLMVEELELEPRFFQVTNSVLCLAARKDKSFPVTGAQRKLRSSLIRDQIRVLDPAIVVPVGGAALEATRQLESHPYRKIVEGVARPIRWSRRWLFPLYHTSMLARNARGGRKPDEQRADWRQLREFLSTQGVVVPSCGT